LDSPARSRALARCRAAATLALAMVGGRAGAATATATPGASPAHTATEQRLSLPIAGDSAIYLPPTATTRMALFVSGDRGWTPAMAAMARSVASEVAVVGVSYPALATAAAGAWCWYPSEQLEIIARAAQQQLAWPSYEPPLLLGYASGATLVYAALATARPGTFAGGVSLAFCPGLVAPRNVCENGAWRPRYDARRGTSTLPAGARLGGPWIVLAGLADRVCDPEAGRRFVTATPGGEIVMLPRVGHGFSRPGLWGERLRDAVRRLPAVTPPGPSAPRPSAPSARELEAALGALGLPLTGVWPEKVKAVLVFFTGDGGWAALDRTLAEGLLPSGVATIGVSSLRYFWRAQAPAHVADDLRRLVSVLERAKVPIYVGGYSFGAEIVPVVVSSLPESDRRRLAGLLLVAPGASASFEIDPLDWIREPEPNPRYLVDAAVQRLAGMRVLCLAGTADQDTACAALRGSAGVDVVLLPGSHHFGGDYEALVKAARRLFSRP
jgi:type IV secretory pathway VirJ component